MFDGLTAGKAHNAVAALVEMYSSALLDNERSIMMLRAQIDRTNAVHADQLTAGKAANEKLFNDLTEARAELQKLRESIGVP